jgi:hypothetical protein
VPISFEDASAQNISGDPAPTRPLTQRQMQGAMNRNVNRTQLGPKPVGKGMSPGQANGKPEQKPQAEQDQPDAKTKADVGAPQPQQASGSGFQAVSDGIAQITNDPAWQQHPLLHVFKDLGGGAVEEGIPQDQQDLWAATQWWGRVVNAAIDPNAIHASASNIEHDNSVGAQILKHMAPGVFDPQTEFAWNVIPYALSMAVEWEPWLFLPSMAAGGPQQANQLPAAAMSLFGGDLMHPQFSDPDWYARMGSYVIAAGLAAKGGGSASSKILKFSGRLKVFDGLTEHMDRVLGGPGGGKTPIERVGVKGPDGGTHYDPEAEVTKYAQWWQDNVEALEAKVSSIGLKPKEQIETYTYQKIPIAGLPGEYAERKVPTPVDKSSLPDLAGKLGLSPLSTPEEIKSKMSMLINDREISTKLSEQILKGWQDYGAGLGMVNKIKYVSQGEAPFRNVEQTLGQIEDANVRNVGTKAMTAANGIHADVMQGLHSYGNDTLEAMTKGVMQHSRDMDHWGKEVLRNWNDLGLKDQEWHAVTDAIEDPSKYEALSPAAKFVADMYRRLNALDRDRKIQVGVPDFKPQPDHVHRVKVSTANLEKVLGGTSDPVRLKARGYATSRILATIPREHRAIRLTQMTPQDLYAEVAHKTTRETNAQVALWRQQVKNDLISEAKSNPTLKAVTDDPKKLDALVRSEIHEFSTDIRDSFRQGMMPSFKATLTHETLEELKQNLVFDKAEGRWHPLAVSRTPEGQESSPTLPTHFKQLHDADTTKNFYAGKGYKQVHGFSSGPYIFHPGFTDPINRLYDLYGKDPDGWYKALAKAAGVGRHLIMVFNPLWHAWNMSGRFAMMGAMHPGAMADQLLRAKGLRGDLTAEERQNWWAAQRRERILHGGVPPRLSEDVVGSIQRQHTFATGDPEMAEPIDGKQPAGPLSAAAAGALDAIKGVDHWWERRVNDHFWNTYNNFADLAYIVMKDDALQRGMSPGDARIWAASRANRFGGMVSPDRWAYNPGVQKASNVLAFAPNWWRTFPGMFLGTYDRMGMKTAPALSNAWALHSAKAIGAMLLTKMASDNLLNWMMNGHWQFQNAPGYQNQITMDRFFPPDPNTGAHHVMENPMERQPTDLEKALGLFQAAKNGGWSEQLVQEGLFEVAAARVSPLVDALEVASNYDIYNSIKQKTQVWVDPSHPYPGGGPPNWLAALSAFSPLSFVTQSAVGGLQAVPGQLNWGPWAGKTLPGWAMRALNPNEPISNVMGWLGIRGGYPAPIKTDQPGLSDLQRKNIADETNSWNSWLAKHQQDVQSGGMTWNTWLYDYRNAAAAHANTLKGFYTGTTEYTQGADGLLAQYEAIYNNKDSFDKNGDINWASVQRQQDQLQSQADPATWRQMQAIRTKKEMQYPILRAYSDTMQNYRNWQDQEAIKLKMHPEDLRALISEGAQAPDFTIFKNSHPQLHKYYADKDQWELHTKQGFAYGLFTNNFYVMRVVAPHGTAQEAETREQQILPQIEEMEKAGTFVTKTGE